MLLPTDLILDAVHAQTGREKWERKQIAWKDNMIMLMKWHECYIKAPTTHFLFPKLFARRHAQLQPQLVRYDLPFLTANSNVATFYSHCPQKVFNQLFLDNVVTLYLSICIWAAIFQLFYGRTFTRRTIWLWCFRITLREHSFKSGMEHGARVCCTSTLLVFWLLFQMPTLCNVCSFFFPWSEKLLPRYFTSHHINQEWNYEKRRRKWKRKDGCGCLILPPKLLLPIASCPGSENQSATYNVVPFLISVTGIVIIDIVFLQ